MDSLVQDRIYRRIALTDYQGLCSDRDNPYSGAGFVARPNHQLSWLYKYAVSLAATWLSMFSLPAHAYPYYETKTFPNAQEGMMTDEDGETDPNYPNYDDEDDYVNARTPNDNMDATAAPPRAQPVPPPPPPPGPQAKVEPDASFTRSCDLKSDLYILQPERLNSSTPLKVIWNDLGRIG